MNKYLFKTYGIKEDVSLSDDEIEDTDTILSTEFEDNDEIKKK